MFKVKYYFYFQFIFILIIVHVLWAQEKNIYIRQIDSTGQTQRVSLRSTTYDKPENVLILYNINYQVDENDNNIWDGYEIAEYYRQKRQIPIENIQAIETSVNSQITRSEYDTYFDDSGNYLGIRQQVENILQTKTDSEGNPLRTEIKYIVLTKGIPYKISFNQSDALFSADYASVDASLAMIFNGNYNISWYIPNPYYNQDPAFTGEASFIPEFYTNSDNLRLSFLVTRLDGYTVADVKSMIDRGSRADSLSRTGTFILDGDQKTYDHMQQAAKTLNALGANVYPDPWVDGTDNILSIEDSVTAIITHGVHAGLPSSYITDLYDFKLKDGAVFSSYESYNAASFSFNSTTGQGQIADFIHIGGSGGVGNVYEPYSSNIPVESILLPAYYSGYTFGEAAYMSLKNMDWTAVVIGDPLMRIARHPEPVPFENFRFISVKPNVLAFGQSTTTVARIVFNQAIDTLNLPDFLIPQTGDTLNSFIKNQSIYLWPRQPLPYSSLITYTANRPLYSITGDSLILTEYARFFTHPVEQQPVAPDLYDAYPSGIDIDVNNDLLFIFSMAMKPETIYPILSSPEIEQNHHWTDNVILRVSHTPFLQGTKYSFYIDEHAKSTDDVGLSQSFQLNFKTEFNSVAYDIDNDGFPEYVRNNNNTLLDGYETFEDNSGTLCTVYNTSDFNSDNQKEFFIKLPGNNFPSFFWNPNAVPATGYVDICTAVDDDEDGQTEYAFDANGSGYYTHVYDPGDVNHVRKINYVLLNSNPADQQVNAELSNRLTLIFSKPPSLANLSSNISIDPAIPIESIYTGQNGREINIHFSENFPPSSDITVTLDQNLVSIDNDLLPHGYNIQFHTVTDQKQDPPRVISFYPGDSLVSEDNTPTVRFVFSKPMKTNLSIPVIADTLDAVSWSHYWADFKTLYLFPLQELAENKNYKFRLSPELQDTSGLLVEGKDQFNFTSISIAADNNKPVILQIIPEPGHVIPIGKDIKIIYSERITSEQNQWINIQPQQSYNWSAAGFNMFSFRGDPAWRPQSNLILHINGTLIHDAHLNNFNTNYDLNYFVLGDIIQRDVDNDGIEEYVTDYNGDPGDGLEIYIDPGGIETHAVFSGDIDKDGFYDFLITDTTGSVILAWYPAKSDSGIIGYGEQIGKSKFEVSVDTDNLVEYTINTDSATVTPVIPRIRSVQPLNSSDQVSLFTPFILQFNTSMEPFSIIQSVAFSYPQKGEWTAGNLNSKFRFEPENGWLPALVYTMLIKPGYTAENGQTGKDSTSVSFRTTDGKNVQMGNLSWQFPAHADTVYPESDYFFAFDQNIDSSKIPEFIILQNFSSKKVKSIWLADTLLKVFSPETINEGPAILQSSGYIHFLNSPQMDFDKVTNYNVSKGVSLKLIKTLFNPAKLLPLSPTLPFLFNQPFNPGFSNNISLSKIVAGDTIATAFNTSVLKNILFIIPDKLDYASTYLLSFNRNLTGLSGNKLNKELNYTLNTESLFKPSASILKWQQAEDFLILSWPVANADQAEYELYVCGNITEKPDTVNFKNRYSLTEVPKWLFDLQRFPEEACVYIRLMRDDLVYWSKPVYIFNNRYTVGNLISLPVTQNISLDTLLNYQKYVLSLSQWHSEISGWNSAKYLKDEKKWNTDIILNNPGGVLLRPSRDGRFGWVQNLVPDITFDVTSQQLPRYYGLINPYTDISAEALASVFGKATRLAIWDNQQQGWNEAVYDSISDSWVNNFTVKFLQPVYVYTASGFNSSAMLPKNQIMNQEKFPSCTHILHFNARVFEMKVFKNDAAFEPVIGCGVDSLTHFAFINTGNLDDHYKWYFRFYDNSGNAIGEFEYGRGTESIQSVPTSFKLTHPYPNPFNNVVTLPLQVPDKGQVTIDIYNILGQKIFSDHINIKKPNIYLYKWNGTKSSGIYFVRAEYKSQSRVAKVVLIK